MAKEPKILIDGNDRFSFIAKTFGIKLFNHVSRWEVAPDFVAFSKKTITQCLTGTAPGNELLTQQVLIILNLLATADPTPKSYKYLQWIVCQYLGRAAPNRELDSRPGFPLEDLDRLRVDLQTFEKEKAKLKGAGLSIDINSYKSTTDVFTAIQKISGVPDVVSVKELDRMIKKEFAGQIKQFHLSDKIKILIPETQAASCYLGRGTRWCTAATKSTNYFDDYSKAGPLYIIFTEKGRFQLHFGDETKPVIADEKDTLLKNSSFIREFPELRKAFNDIAIQKNYIPLIEDVTSDILQNVLVKIAKKIFEMRGNDLEALRHTESYRNWAVGNEIKSYFEQLGSVSDKAQSIEIAIQSAKIDPIRAKKFTRPDLLKNPEVIKILGTVTSEEFALIPKADHTEKFALKVLSKNPLRISEINPDVLTPAVLKIISALIPDKFWPVIPANLQTREILAVAIKACKGNVKMEKIVANGCHNKNLKTEVMNDIRLKSFT